MNHNFIYDSVKKTSEYLHMLSKVGKYNFRKTINMSNQDLDKLIEENGLKLTASVRDGFIMNWFIESKELREEYEQFHRETMAELEKIYNKENENGKESI